MAGSGSFTGSGAGVAAGASAAALGASPSEICVRLAHIFLISMPAAASLPLSLMLSSSPFIISTDSRTTSMISGVIFSSPFLALFKTSSIW